MKLIIAQFPIILVSIAYALGVFLSNYGSVVKGNVLTLLSLSIVLSVGLIDKSLKHKDEFKTFVLLVSIVIISFLLNSQRVHNTSNNDETTLNTEIIIIKLFNSSDRYQNCIVKDVVNSRKYLAQIKLRDTITYKVGSKLFIDAGVERINSLKIPNNFNFSKYLSRRNVASRLIINTYVETTDGYNLSRKIEDKIDNSSLSDLSKGLFKALVLGRKEGLPDELLDSFSDSGIMHLLALSGLHIGILTIILMFLLKPIKLLRRGKLIRSIMVVLLLWNYAYITGFSPSIIRATIMFSIIVIGHGMRREVNIFNSLAIAALVLLIINPNFLFDVGFQLSFSAVIGIVWIYPLLGRLWRPRNKAVRYLWSLLIVSISAQVATFPFTVYYFHKFSGLFFIANIIEIPLITVLLGLSYLILVLLMFGFQLNMMNSVYDKIVRIIELVSLKISDVDSMVFDKLFINEFYVVGLFLLVIAIVLFIENKRIVNLYSALILIIFMQIYSMVEVVNTSKKQILMFAKNEMISQNGFSYSSNYKGGAKLFSNYVLAHGLSLNSQILDDVFSFDETYYLKLSNGIEINPIIENHFIIVDKQVKLNPERIVNSKTIGIVYSGYGASSYKTRWEYFCSRNDIAFYDVNEAMFEEHSWAAVIDSASALQP
jgi:competence protein ComEC